MPSNPPFYTPEVLPIGEAVVTHGLTNVGAIYAVGALMFGLIWECPDIWATLEIPASSSWSASSTTTSTTWAASSTTTSTTWTKVVRSEC